MMKRIILKIYGAVQGVFYRAQVCDIAKNLDLMGYVKNESDGSVEIVVEGEESVLEMFIEKCYTIPNAKVEKIEEKWGDADGEYNNFEIKY